MTSFYIKTDLDVAGPFTGVELREASLAGIVRPETYLAGQPDGPWVAAQQAGLFSETGVALPHPPQTAVPMFQTRGMPGAFMGPFKLRELIGFACQGMMPPGTELQSDPTRPWIPITGTGILPACLRGDLVRIEPNGRLCLRTVIPEDLELRRKQLESLQSPIDRAKAIKASGATAAPANPQIAASKADLKTQGSADVNATGEHPNDGTNESGETNVSRSVGPGHSPVRMDGSVPSVDHAGRFDFAVIRNSLGFVGKLAAQPKLAAALLLVATLTIGLPVAYSSWARRPIPRQAILGQWIAVVDGDKESDRPEYGVRFHPDGTCVLVDAEGVSWTGDFKWTERMDTASGFRPTDQTEVRYDEAEPGHAEDVVLESDGYVLLDGFVKEPPMLDGHPVRDLFVRRMGERLKVGYLTASRWTDGRQELTAAWAELNLVPPTSRSIFDILRELPEELAMPSQSAEQAKTISVAIDDAIKGREFEYKNQKKFRHGCFTFSQVVDAGYLLQHAGVPDLARPLRPFEAQPSYNGPSMEQAQLLRYGGVDFFINPEGQIMFIEVNVDAV